MKKINDRFLLGIVAGIGGNQVKSAIGAVSKRAKWAEISGKERAAGMLVPSHTISTPEGKFVGRVADNIIGGLLGVVTVYALGITGNNNAVLKGALTGQASWTILYGVFGTLGATKVSPVSPSTVIAELVGHTVYGATAAFMAVRLGNPGLFDGTIPFKPGKSS